MRHFAIFMIGHWWIGYCLTPYVQSIHRHHLERSVTPENVVPSPSP
jgi:hypothetical protein